MKGALALVVLALGLVSAQNNKKIVCYYGSWAVYRPEDGKFDVEDIDPNICTHAIYGFAGLSGDGSGKIVSLDSYNDLEENFGKGAFVRFTKLKELNPSLKTILAVGGWNEGSQKYSEMAASASGRENFVSSAVEFMQKYGFDGLDIDWEYPGFRGGSDADKENYVLVLEALRSEFNNGGWMITSAVSAGKPTIDGAYDVPEISSYFDHIHLMAYDYHGSWELFTGANAPMYAHPEESTDMQTFNVNFSVNYWLSLGAPKEKLILGMPLYGHSWTLSDPNSHQMLSTATGAGTAGPYTREAGTLGYNEICVNIQGGGWTKEWDDYYKSPYIYNGNQFVAYDDTESLQYKTDLINGLGLAGGMVWSLETDDFRARCGDRNPLMTFLNVQLRGEVPPSPSTTTPNPNATTTSQATTQTTTQGNNTQPTTVNPDPIINLCLSHGETYVRDPNDCSTYYECIFHGTGNVEVYTFHCGAGTVFDEVTDTCTWPANVPECNTRRKHH